MLQIDDHPLRFKVANELHTRPFPIMEAPCTAAFIALKQKGDAATRDPEQEFAHLLELLDRHGAPHPQPNATHYYGQIGKNWLKWEQHTEFVTYTVFNDGLDPRPFEDTVFSSFPSDWLANAPGQRVTSVSLRMEKSKSGIKFPSASKTGSYPKVWPSVRCWMMLQLLLRIFELIPWVISALPSF